MVVLRPLREIFGGFSVSASPLRVIVAVEDDLGSRLGAVFAAQDGVATVAQLERIGATRAYRRTRLRKGEWQQLSATVIGVTSTPDSQRRRVRAAWMDAGASAAVSHATAAWLHGMDGLDRETEIHVTICSGRHAASSLGAIVHHSRLITPRECDHVAGIRVVPRPVALVQVAGSRGKDAAAQALDGMLRRGDKPAWIERTARAWLRPGVGGAACVLDLLAQRIDTRLPRSWYQRIASRLLASHELHAVDEHPVFDSDGRQLAALDLALPHLQIGIECQSWEWHGTPSAQAHDARRRRRLRMLGWEIVDVWWSDLDRIDEVVAEVQYLIDRRRSLNLA